MIDFARGQDDSDQLLQLFQRMVEHNLDNDHAAPTEEINGAMQRFQSLPLGQRIAAWASWFADRGVAYQFGRDSGGYVDAGRIVDDQSTDCVLFMYRATELARSTTAEEAVQFAFGTRFYGASLESVVAPDGRVDYDDASHLDYSEDMIQSGVWGEDITTKLGAATETAQGPRGAVTFIPRTSVPLDRLENGDIVWFVGDETGARSGASSEGGTIVHHIGIVDRTEGSVDLIHAAVKPLPGAYAHAGVVRVPLATYLERIDRFRGVVVTRLAEF